MKDMADILRGHPFVEGLDADTVALIAGCAKNAVYAAGAWLFREGQAADRFFLVREGQVALECFAPGRGPLTVLTVGAGEIVGASWLIPPYRYAFDARAAKPTRALAFDARCLRDKCEADPRVGYEMMKRFIPPLVKRLHEARLQTLDLRDDAGFV
jgi:CRP-like cAMP-binding protein